MKLKQPRKCGDCLASIRRQYSAPYCKFGFKTEHYYGPPPFKMAMAKPIEQCWKPTTTKEYIACREYRDMLANPTNTVNQTSNVISPTIG